MEKTKNRNESAREFLEALYNKALDRTFLPNEAAYVHSVEKLFQTEVWGFREILLVVIVGMKLDPSFRASTGLYDCNPRAIYEGPIKEFLDEKDLPHRKSGPLNVAKATPGLNGTWAKQRRPADVAGETVKLVEFLESADDKIQTLEHVGVSILRRLIAQAKKRAALTVDVDPCEDPARLYSLCREMITKAPDAGNTPQKIVALLLKCFHDSFGTGVVVTGGEDRASVTSTTSKKPGDINEERDGKIYKVYEVTVKPFDSARIADSFDCISIYNEENAADIREVIVICRREDCPLGVTAIGADGRFKQYDYRGISYYFCDIFEWIVYLLQRMTSEGRRAFWTRFNEYVGETNTAGKVKRLWKELNE